MSSTENKCQRCGGSIMIGGKGWPCMLHKVWGWLCCFCVKEIENDKK